MAKFDPPAKFSFNASEWTDWISEFKRFRIATKLDKEPGEVQRDDLLYAMGVKEAEKIFKTFTYGDDEDDTKFDLLEKKFTAHFVPRVNIRHERAKFCERSQGPNESVEHFVRDLYALVATCKYTDENDQILDRIVQGVRDPHVRRKLQLMDGLDLKTAIATAQQYELVKRQEEERKAPEVEETFRGRGRSRGRSRGRYRSQGRGKGTQNNDGGKGPCSRCHGDHQKNEQCPASGQICSYCHLRGHFKVACFKCKNKMKRNASKVEQQKHEEESYVDDFWIDTVEVIKETSSAWYHPVEVNGKKIDFKLDSGADLTLITQNTYHEIVPKPKLDRVNFKLNSPGGRVRIVGQFVAHSEHQGKPYKFRVTVAKVRNNLEKSVKPWDCYVEPQKLMTCMDLAVCSRQKIQLASN